MGNEKQQVEMMTKALLSRCAGLYSQEKIGNEIMNFSDRIVKLLIAPPVSKCEGTEREALLVAFYEWRNGELLDDKLEIETFLKEYDSNQ